MEEENKTEEENNDVPIEEVNRVIEGESKESEVIDDYVDLTEDAAKKELDTMIVPETSEDAEDLINSSVETNKTKSVFKPINMDLLQFQCDECNFKSYINLEDEKVNPLPEIIRCISCGKKKAIKKRILNMILNDFMDIQKQEETVEEEVAKEE